MRAPLATREPRLEGLRVLVVGLGRSGRAAVRLAAAKGARLTVTDLRPEPEIREAVAEARGAGAGLHLGEHPPALALETDLAVVSPGVRLDTPLVEACVREGVPVWSEVELAWRFCRGRILAITGSNGKSTVTSMAGRILRTAGVPGGTGGNLGTPLSDLLDSDGPDAIHAVELSSFQLEAIDRFEPAVAVVVNLTADHLDRYPSFEEYARAKARLLEAQTPEGFAVLNADDPESGRLRSAVRARLFEFSTRRALDRGGFVENETLTLSGPGGRDRVMKAAEVPVPGDHNRANALAAALACRLLGCGVESIARGLRSYRALPHRLEHVATLSGVAFYDDSKATNTDACARALESFPEGRVHLILGGRDKGADWRALAPLVRRHARRLLLVGEAAETIGRELRDAADVEVCGTVPDAVRVGFESAREGDCVLLSPGCASFDQYPDFEARGADFQRAVRRLAEKG